MSLLLLLASSGSNVTGTASVAFGLSVSATGTADPPEITGTATVPFGLTASASGTATPPPLSARGTTRPIRTPADPRRARRTAVQQLHARASVAPITATGTAQIGITVAGTGTAEPPAITGTATAQIGLTVTASGTAEPPEITGTVTTLVGVTVTGTGTATPPDITGSATATFGVTVSATGTVGDTTPPVARGIVRPLRSRRDPRRIRLTAPQTFLSRAAIEAVTGSAATVSFGLTVSATGTADAPVVSGTGTATVGLTVTATGTATPPDITATATALFELTVTATGTAPGASGLTNRGIIRPTRSRPDPRRSRIGAAQVLARTIVDVSGTATATFGLTVGATGTATPPAITGTATAQIGLTVSATGTVAAPVYTGTATALFGLTVSGTMTVPLFTRAIRVLDASRPRLTVTDAGTVRLEITAALTERVDATYTGVARVEPVATTTPRVAVLSRSFFPEGIL